MCGGIFERHFKKLFAVIIIGELTNSLWHLCWNSFVVSLDSDDFTFIAHAQKRQSERLQRPGKYKRDNGIVCPILFKEI